MLSSLDILLCVPLLWAAFKGFRNGFIKEAFSVAALILGIFITYKFSYFVEEKLGDMFAARVVAFVITFFAVLIGVHFVGILVDKVIKVVIPNAVDRILGVGFGIAKWLFICGALLFVMNTIDVKHKILKPNVTESSLLYPYVEKSTHFIADWAEK